MNFPDNLKYTKDHEWVRLDGNIAFIGITDYAQAELGDIVYVDVTSVGEALNAHDVFGTIEAVKTVSDMFMPVAGEVAEVNPQITDNPEIINKDPYGDGWIVKVVVADTAQLSELMDAAAYQASVGH